MTGDRHWSHLIIPPEVLKRRSLVLVEESQTAEAERRCSAKEGA